MKAKKKHYEAPMIEVVPVEMEGAVMVASGSGSLGTMEGIKVSTSDQATPASYSEISDMVEEFFTLE